MSKESERIFALSLIPQVDYNTALVVSAAPKNYEQIHKNNRDFANFQTRTIDDAGYSAGTSFPSERKIDVHDVDATWTERMSSQRLGRRAYAAFGDLVTTTHSGGDAGAYTHLFSPLNPQSGASLPVYTYVEKIGEPALVGNVEHDVKFPSFMAESFELSGNGTGFLEGTTAWRGSAKRIANSGVGFFADKYVGAAHVVLKDDQTNNFFFNTQAQLKIYPQAALGGSPTVISCKYRSFTASLQNNLLINQGYLGCGLYQTSGDPNSGAVRGSMPIGDQSAGFNFVILIEPALDPFGKQMTQAVLSAELIATGSQIGATSKNHKATVKVNKMTYETVSIGSEEGLNAYQISAPPLALGQVMPLQLEVVNNIASYTSLS